MITEIGDLDAYLEGVSLYKAPDRDPSLDDLSSETVARLWAKRRPWKDHETYTQGVWSFIQGWETAKKHS